MRTLCLTTILLVAVNCLNAQEKFTVPGLTSEQKQEVLYNHVMSYAVTGISFAKTQDVAPEKYGRYVGNLFKPYWNPEDGFPAFANGMMYLLKGIHPDNEMQIVEQNEKMVKFKLKNVDLLFQEGPYLGISYEEMLAFSYGVISELADYMNVNFSHSVTEDMWYEVTIKAK